MGKKYIIELEDENYHQYSDSEPSDYLWRVKGFNALVFDEVGISKLTPYTEPDLERVKKTAHDDGYSEGYQAGREDLNRVMAVVPDVEQIKKEAYSNGYDDGYNGGRDTGLADAWEAARKIVMGDINTITSAFDTASRSFVIRDLTAAEVFEKLRAYEQEQEEKKKKTNYYFEMVKDAIETTAEECGMSLDEVVAILEKMRNESNAQIDT